MECPACKRPLDQLVVAGVTVDACDSCAGIWFDSHELKKFDEPHESAGEELLDLPRAEALSVDREARYHCPTCGDVVLMRHYFSANKAVEVDECPSCGGFWLDAGELHSIRVEFPTEEARDAAAVAMLEEIFADDMLAQREQSEAELARARRIANMFRFICPSNYLPGKQEGAAF